MHEESIGRKSKPSLKSISAREPATNWGGLLALSPVYESLFVSGSLVELELANPHSG